MENAKDLRRENLLIIRQRIVRMYQERLGRKYGSPSYNAKMQAKLAGQIGALNWALEQNERS